MTERATPEEPRTFRPFGARIAAVVGGVGLLVVCAAAWLAFPPHIRAMFTVFERITMVFLFGLGFGVWLALMRCRVVASVRGLTVVNGYRRHELEWAQVIAVRLPAGAPWATLDLSDGTTLALFGIQGSDGDRARAAVRELRRRLRLR